MENSLINAIATLAYWHEIKDQDSALDRLISSGYISEEEVEDILNKRDEIERREDRANDMCERLQCGDARIPSFRG